MRKKHEHSPRGSKTTSLSETALLNLGHHHHALEIYLVRLAQNEGDPYLVAPYAERLSELLADTAVRAMAGDPTLLPDMWQNGFAVDQRRRHPLRHVDQSAQELIDRPSGARTLSNKARKAIAKAQHKRWAKFHDEKKKKTAGWTPARRKKYSKMMKKRWADPKTGRRLREILTAATKGRKFSPETRAKISAAQQSHWAKKRMDAA